MSTDYGWGMEPTAGSPQPQSWGGGWGEEPAPANQTTAPAWGNGDSGGWGESAPTQQSQSWGEAMGQVGPGGAAWGQQAKPKKKRRWVRPVITGTATVSVLAFYFGFLVPPVKDIPIENRGITSYSAYMTALAGFNADGLNAIIPDSYVAKESAYLNGNQTRIKAVQAITGTVSYSVPDSPQLTWRTTGRL